MNQERLMQVLLAPQISEKATYVADKNEQVIFRVAPMRPSRKSRLRLSCCSRSRLSPFRSPTSRARSSVSGCMGRRKGWKKAYVCLKPGQEINFVEGGNA
jgi:large subunit ribosomal protein L23